MVFYDERELGERLVEERAIAGDFGGWAETAAEVNAAFANASYPNWRSKGARATTDDRKADACDAILAVWREFGGANGMRLGQLLRNALRAHSNGRAIANADFATALFYIEDADLLAALEKFGTDYRESQERYRANRAALEAAANDGVGK